MLSAYLCFRSRLAIARRVAAPRHGVAETTASLLCPQCKSSSAIPCTTARLLQLTRNCTIRDQDRALEQEVTGDPISAAIERHKAALRTLCAE